MEGGVVKSKSGGKQKQRTLVEGRGMGDKRVVGGSERVELWNAESVESGCVYKQRLVQKARAYIIYMTRVP